MPHAVSPASPATDAAAAAPAARRTGLVHTTDARPGIGRVRVGDDVPARFRYVDANGRPLTDAAELARIARLAIPPAYTDVWICPHADGHLQATGRDARGRKQYRYHADWQALRGEDKFARLEAFGRVLPRIRARVARDLRPRPGTPMTRAVVLATIVRLLDTTFVRVGNAQYARDNKSYGLTTLRNRHAGVEGDALRLRFRGKSGVMHAVELHDRRVAAVVRRCRQMPGQELFQWQDEAGALHVVDSGDVNDYLAAAAGDGVTAKNFRTWHGTVLALELTRTACAALHAAPGGRVPAEAGRRGAAGSPRRARGGQSGSSTRRDAGPVAQVRLDPAARFSPQEVLAQVARRLGNTPAVCRKAYVHPAVLELGTRLAADPAALADFAATPAEALPARGGLSAAERRLAAFLKQAGRGPRAKRPAHGAKR